MPEGICPNCLFARAREDIVLSTCDSTTVVAPLSGPSPAKATGTVDPSPGVGVGGKLQYFGDYELLGEIARGGMGVVYRARQTSLNRIVAVKMILAGQLAAEADVKRFRTESEAAANLQHPNIVAIHEVGEHDGRHYFSMDYVEGTNLAELVREGPLAAGKAASLVKTIAEAIHYAHQRGTLHRDLKPQNVLIDAVGQPRITDFGLAKLTKQDSGVTQTGTVMGSPSYMPPEQASGRHDQVGPASDVYSIGAIFYQLLTGRAPFRAETPLATLQLLLNEEPVRPSRLNPRTPPDLETICLKCLEKRPERRYHSARELAEEVGRFLDESPILARPPHRLRKAWSWAVRNPWVLTGSASFLLLGLIGLAYGLWEQNRFLIWRQAHAAARVPDSGVWAFVLFLGCLFGVGVAPGAFADLVDRKRKALRFGSTQYWSYGSIGVLGVLGGIVCALGLVHSYVWGGIDPGPFFQGAFMAVLPGMWFGALLLWHLVRQFQLGAYARERLDEVVLFPPVPRQPSSVKYVSKRQASNRYQWVALVIVAASLLLVKEPSARAGFDYIALGAAFLPLVVVRYREVTSANQHLILLGGLLCVVTTVMMVLRDPFTEVAANPVAPEIRRQSHLMAVGLGLACAWVLLRFERQKAKSRSEAEVIEVADLPTSKPGIGHSLVMLFLSSILIVILGCLVRVGWLFSGATDESRLWLFVLATFAFAQTYEVSCWLRAAGVERRARANSVAVMFVACAMIFLTHSIAHGVQAVAVGAGVGVLARAFLRSRRLDANADPTASRS